MKSRKPSLSKGLPATSEGTHLYREDDHPTLFVAVCGAVSQTGKDMTLFLEYVTCPRCLALEGRKP